MTPVVTFILVASLMFVLSAPLIIILTYVKNQNQKTDRLLTELIDEQT